MLAPREEGSTGTSFRIWESGRKCEETLFQELLKLVNMGEATRLAASSQQNDRILTDDRDTRELAAQLKIPISDTLGILLRLVHTNALTLSETNEMLGRMVSSGYRSPVQKLEDL